jgi:hypothetical protein
MVLMMVVVLVLGLVRPGKPLRKQALAVPPPPYKESNSGGNDEGQTAA